MEDYSTFVNGYDIDSFDYLFDKFIFLKKNKKMKKNRPKSPHIKSAYQPPVIGFNNC
jgi:hypothetical protein